MSKKKIHLDRLSANFLGTQAKWGTSTINETAAHPRNTGLFEQGWWKDINVLFIQFIFFRWKSFKHKFYLSHQEVPKSSKENHWKKRSGSERV